MTKTYTFSECYKLLDVDPKTFGRWLEKAGIDPKQQVSKIDNRIRFLTQEQIDRLAADHGRTPSQIAEEPQESTALSTLKLAIEGLRGDVRFLQEQYGSMKDVLRENQARIASLTGQLAEAHETIAILQAPKRATKAKSVSESSEALPDNLVAWRSFADLHTCSQTTTGRYVEQGLIHVVRGKWKVGNGYVKEALDAPGRRDFWAQFHSKDGFTSCDDCPHELTQS